MAQEPQYEIVPTPQGSIRVEIPAGLEGVARQRFALERARVWQQRQTGQQPLTAPQGGDQSMFPENSMATAIGQGVMNLPRNFVAAGPQVAGEEFGRAAGFMVGGPTGGAIGGGLGSAVGESIDQIAGHINPDFSFTPPPETSMDSARRIALAAAFGAVPGFAGNKSAPGLMDEALLGRTPTPTVMPKGTRDVRQMVDRASPEGQRGINPSELGFKLDVELSPAQQSQGIILSAIEGIMRRSLFGGGLFKRFDIRQAVQMNDSADRLIGMFQAGQLSQRQIGQLIQQTIRQFDEGVGRRFALIKDNIVSTLGDVPLDSEDVAKSARNLLEQFGTTEQFKSLRGVESLNKAIRILEDFAGITQRSPIQRQTAVRGIRTEVPGAETSVPVVRQQRTFAGEAGESVDDIGEIVRTGSVDEAVGEIPVREPSTFTKEGVVDTVTTTAGELEVTQPLRFSDAVELRKLLFAIGNSGETDAGKGAIQQMTHALHKAIDGGLRSRGQAGEEAADLFVNASTNVRQVKEALETSFIRSITRADKPAAIAKILIDNPTDVMPIVNGLVRNSKTRRGLQAAVLEEMFHRTRQGDIFTGNKLDDMFKKLRPEGQKALFPDDEHRTLVRDFIDLVDTANLSSQTRIPVSGTDTSLLAFGEFRAGREAGAALSGAAGGFLLGSVVLGAAGPGALMFAGMGGASMVVGPALIAKIMTSPRLTRQAVELFNAPVGSVPKQKVLAFGTALLAQQAEQSIPPIPMERATVQENAPAP